MSDKPRTNDQIRVDIDSLAKQIEGLYASVGRISCDSNAKLGGATLKFKFEHRQADVRDTLLFVSVFSHAPSKVLELIGLVRQLLDEQDLRDDRR